MNASFKVFDESTEDTEKDVAKKARLREYNELLKKMISDSDGKDPKASKQSPQITTSKFPNNVYSLQGYSGSNQASIDQGSTIKKSAAYNAKANYFDDTNPLNNSFGTPVIKKAVASISKEYDPTAPVLTLLSNTKDVKVVTPELETLMITPDKQRPSRKGSAKPASARLATSQNRTSAKNLIDSIPKPIKSVDPTSAYTSNRSTSMSQQSHNQPKKADPKAEKIRQAIAALREKQIQIRNQVRDKSGLKNAKNPDTQTSRRPSPYQSNQVPKPQQRSGYATASKTPTKSVPKPREHTGTITPTKQGVLSTKPTPAKSPLVRRNIKIKETTRSSALTKQPASAIRKDVSSATYKPRTPIKTPRAPSRVQHHDKAARMNAARALAAFLEHWSSKVEERILGQALKITSAVSKKLKVKDQFATEFRIYWLLNLSIKKLKSNQRHNLSLKKAARRINIIISGRKRETFREVFESIRREYAVTSTVNYISGGVSSSRSQGLSPAYKPQAMRTLALSTQKHHFVSKDEDDDSLPSGRTIRRPPSNHSPTGAAGKTGKLLIHISHIASYRQSPTG